MLETDGPPGANRIVGRAARACELAITKPRQNPLPRRAAHAEEDLCSVDAYIASRAPAVQHVLRRVRNAIRQAVPRADEAISYGMPTYKLDGRAVIYFAGWSEHYSVYPWTADVKEALGSELTPYEAGKGTLRFALADPVPVRLIARIAKLRAQEVAERGAKKSRGSPRLRPRTRP
jgi:uncharacterized protein YdhG (YjbR/CyaY superfamily)